MNSEHSNDCISQSDKIKAEAKDLGFFACGIARACAVDDITTKEFRQWIDNGCYAGMEYMTNYPDKRLDPRRLMPEVKSIICVALSYAPQKRLPSNSYQIAAYAYGNDYHEIVKSKLHKLAERLTLQHYRAFCDTAPILERYWAVKAGLGWTGRNHQLIIPNAGSMFFLGELFVNIELYYDKPQKNRCGTCHACIDACPTHALSPESIDTNRCLSYLTIENHGDIPAQYAEQMGNCIYGCDRCQDICPWNRRFAIPTQEPQMQPSDDLLSMTKEKWNNLNEEDYRRLFRGSAVKRAKYCGLMRNIHALTSTSTKDK
jgi:epoxyqueuosine reductase